MYKKTANASYLACLPLVCLLLSCGGDGGQNKTCQAGLLAGDLVITEVMANPLGSDEGKEWFEIYNHTNRTLDLTGVQIATARADGTSEKAMLLAGATIAAGDYFVLGGMVQAVKPSYVDYAYGSALDTLRNTSGKLLVRCGKALIDEVVYLEAKDGTALQFDGSLQPDAAANDQASAWCDAKVEYETGSFGSPGAPNPACGTTPPNTCKDGDNVRDIVAPKAGDLVITEFMADPAKVSDTTGEWFEVYTARDVDLNGLRLGASADEWKDQIQAMECLRATAGAYLVFARSKDAQANGGLPRTDGLFTFSMANTNGSLAIGYGAELLDAVTWTSARSGVASSLEPTLTDPVQNDNQRHWCAAATAYGAGDLGTPGSANPTCNITPQGKCREGSVLRDLRSPAAGDVVITEIMADPSQVADSVGEWFELYIVKEFDLNGLQVGKTPGTVLYEIPSGDCLPAANGSYLVFAPSADQAVNGGLPKVDFPLSFGLTNSGGSLFVGVGGELLDAVTYKAATSGKSWSLDANSFDPDLNNDTGKWCLATATYGAGDFGTPGAVNPACR